MNGVTYVKEIMEDVVVHSKEVQVVGLDVLHAIKKNSILRLICNVVVQGKKELL